MKTLDKHIKAEQLRESEKFSEALRLYDEVMVACIETKDYKRIVEVLQGKMLTYKHLYLNTKKDFYYLLGKGSAKTALTMAKKHKMIGIANCYFRMGEMELAARKINEAEKYFKEAVKRKDKNEAEWGDFIYHLGEVMCELGKKKQGLRKMKRGMKHIDMFEGKMDDYVFKVWKSGVLMKIAKVDDKNRKKYMKKAKKIVFGDERLIIRRKQFSKLAEEMEKAKKKRKLV